MRLIEALRRLGYAGPLTLVSGEAHRPYDRPPLTKAVLRGAADSTTFPVDMNALGVDVRLGVRACALDAADHRVTLVDGTSFEYQSLALAPGATPRWLPGTAGKGGVHVVRTIDDAVALREAASSARRVAVVGGGFIGCEVAASLTTVGIVVDLVEVQPAPLLPQLGPVGAGIVADLLTERGVRLRAGAGVTDVLGDAVVSGLQLDDGTVLETDVVVLGLGVIPDVSWLGGSGLRIDDGITCNGSGRTSADGVWALGDAASWHHPLARGPVRVEHWTSVIDQAAVVAEDIVRGEAADLNAVPYFWSDIFDLRIQALGFVGPSDAVHILTPGGTTVIAYSNGGRLTALVGFSAARHIMRLRQCVADSAPIEAVIEKLSDRS